MSEMIVDSRDSSEIYLDEDLDRFAQALESSRITHSDVLERYKSIASERATELFEKDTKKFEQAELEARLWALVQNVYGFRLNQSDKTIAENDFNGDAVIQDAYLRKHAKSRELWIIVSWLYESMIAPDEPNDLRATRWLYTKNDIKKARLQKFQGGLLRQATNAPRRSSALAPRPDAGLVTHLDPDAPIRENSGIAKDDEEFDHSIYKCIFQQLLANQIDAALELCEKTRNYTLKIAIRGMNGYVDKDLDAPLLEEELHESAGIERKPLWRRMCYELARCQTIDRYERGIYGFLSNDLASVLDLCDTWESQLLVYLSHVLAEDSESPLKDSGRIESSVLKLNEPPQFQTSVQTVLDTLAHSSNPVVRQQSEDPVRQLAGAVINDTVNLIVDQLGSNLKAMLSGDLNNALANMPYLIRIITHLILYLRSHNRPAGRSDNITTIVQAYIQILCHEDKSHLVPLYISYLDDDLAAETYSFILANVTDPAVRKRHLELGRKYKLDMDHIVRQAVERVFEESVSNYTMRPKGQLVMTIDDTDTRLCNAVEWYASANLFGDAIHGSVFLLRKLLITGRVQAAKYFGTRISLATILKKYDALSAGGALATEISNSTRAEAIEYDRLLQCLNAIGEWQSHYEQLLAKQPRPTITSAPKAWQSQALSLISNISDQVHDICATWVVHLLSSQYFDENSEDWSTIEQLRQMYIPHLLLELVQVLNQGQVVHGKFLKQAVELANVVADEETQLYKYFEEEDLLQEFVQRITIAFTDGIANGEQGIYV